MEKALELEQPLNKINLPEEKTIRVILNRGRGLGHQNAAITLMLNLREKGFKGKFDVCYVERFPYIADHKTDEVSYGYVGKSLEKLIDGFKNPSLDADDNGQLINHPRLGEIEITRIPILQEEEFFNRREFVNLEISGANDSIPFSFRMTKHNSRNRIQLQPTDWSEGGLVYCSIGRSNENFSLDRDTLNNLRLSSSRSQDLEIVDDDKLKFNEKKLLQLVNDKSRNSQLVYGLYPKIFSSYRYDGGETVYDEKTGKFLETNIRHKREDKEQPNIPESVLLSKIVEANLEALKTDKQHKQTVLLLPQDLKKHYEQIDKSLLEEIQFVDLTKGSETIINPNKKIIIVYTGSLSKQVFEHVAVEGTNLPVCCEGCNTRELCEYNGKPFVFMNSNNEQLRRYELKNEESQELQYFASAHLKTESRTEVGVDPLREYIEQVRDGNAEVVEYHRQRKEEFQKRPDSVEFMINELNSQIEKEANKPKEENIPEFRYIDRFPNRVPCSFVKNFVESTRNSGRGIGG